MSELASLPLKWSVIVIARNEEKNLATCLESILTALAGESFEVIVVDSASTDHTIDVARRYPVRVLRVRATVPPRPAIGRYVGYQATRGNLILFMDGDSVLDPNWIAPALAVLDADSSLAGIAGGRQGVVYDGDHASFVIDDEYAGCDHESPAHLGGPAVYRRDALERVGGFNPFMYACEEAELGARLRMADYRLRRLTTRMTRHHRPSANETIAELWRRAWRRFPIGMGQFARSALTHRLPVAHPFEDISRHLSFVVFQLLGIAAIVWWAVTGQVEEVIVWSAAMLLAFVAFAVRSWSLAKPAYYFTEWATIGPMVAWGFLRRASTVDDVASLRLEVQELASLSSLTHHAA